MKHILIVDGYARQTLPMAEGFKAIGCQVTVVCFSKLDVGYLSRFPDFKVLLNAGQNDHAAQEQEVVALVRTGQYDLVIPMTDYSAIYLAKHKVELSKYAYVAVNDSVVFDLAINKLKTMEICEKAGIPAPRTLFSSDILRDVKDSHLRFPLVVKPKTACGSIGFNIVENYEHLESVITQYRQENGELFLQEYIPQDGPQYGAEVFRDRNGKFIFTLIDAKPRWFPLDGGSPTINVSIHHDQMKKMAEELLVAMDWHGYANIDFVVDRRDALPKILEVNARISAAVKLDFCCGINVAKIIHDDAFGEAAPQPDYADGVKTSCILTELLWFLKSKERFRQRPWFLNRRNTTDVIFSWKDWKPFWGFCLQSVKNYRKAMAKRKRH